MVPIHTELMSVATIAETHRIRDKYMDTLPFNQKWKLENAVIRAGIRIRRIENERKQSFKNQLN